MRTIISRIQRLHVFKFTVSTVLAIGLLVPSLAVASGSISGQVMSGIYPIEGIQVDIHHAVNAELVATTLTDTNGLFDSGDLPDGDYKVRFSNGISINSRGYYYLTEYHGANGVDVFELGTTLSVAGGGVVVADETMAITPPTLIPAYDFTIEGGVSDSAELPLEGIEVRIFGSANAELVSTTTTEASGRYGVGFSTFSSGAVKVRFFDPTGTYLPEYYGAGGADDFNLGSIFDAGVNKGIVETMVQKSADEVINEIIDATLAYPELTGRLEQATTLLSDSNPNNDQASCGLLNGFINQINAKERKGELSTQEADALRQSANDAKDLLGCP